MNTLRIISIATALLVASAQAQAMSIPPAPHSHTSMTLQTVSFSSCYMDGLIGAQRSLISHFGRFGGWVGTVLLDTIAGAGAAGVVTLDCLTN